MKDKIKNLFHFIGAAWHGGIHGKIGVFFAVFATFMFVRIFAGDVNICRFVANIWHLNHERIELTTEEAKLNTINHHIELLENYSPDYIEELGLRYLNIGDPAYRVLKI
jgi:hypothetical protein